MDYYHTWFDLKQGVADVEFATAGGTWSKRYDGSSAFPALAAADVDAVFAPEPAATLAFLAATAALLGRRRSPSNR